MAAGTRGRKFSRMPVLLGLLVIGIVVGSLQLSMGTLAFLSCAAQSDSIPHSWHGTWTTARGRSVVVHRTLVSTVEGTACRDLSASQRDERLDVCVGTFIIDASEDKTKSGGVYEISSFHTYAPTRRVDCTSGFIKTIPGNGIEIVLGQHDEDPMCEISVRLTKMLESRKAERVRVSKKRGKLSKAERRKAEAIEEATQDLPHSRSRSKNEKVRRAQERIRRSRGQRSGDPSVPGPVPGPGGRR